MKQQKHLPKPSPKLMPSDILPPTTHISKAPPLFCSGVWAAALTHSAYSLKTASTSAALRGSWKILFFADS